MIWPSDQYRVNTNAAPGRIYAVNGWPAEALAVGESVYVTYEAGVDSPDDLNPALTSAVLSIFGAWYENREASVVQPGVIDAKIKFILESLLRFRRV